MRVAIACPAHVYQYSGGGEVLLDKTFSYIQKLGIEVRLFDPWKDKIDQFDIVHYFGIGYFNYEFLRTVGRKNTKLILTPIFPVLEGMDSFRRELYFRSCFAASFLKTPPELMRRNAKLADLILAGSEIEKKQLCDLFSVPDENVKAIHYGADRRFLDAKPDLFKNKFGISDFVLCVGRFDFKQKNQLMLIRALKNLGYKSVFVGNPDKGMDAYYQMCKKEANKNTLFIDSLPQDSELLASCYAAARVFVVPSKFEYPGLAGMEAALAGCGRFAMTSAGCTKEYYKDFAFYFDPYSVKDIARAVIKAHDSENNSSLIREHFKKNYLWENYALAVKNAYAEMLNER